MSNVRIYLSCRIYLSTNYVGDVRIYLDQLGGGLAGILGDPAADFPRRSFGQVVSLRFADETGEFIVPLDLGDALEKVEDLSGNFW